MKARAVLVDDDGTVREIEVDASGTPKKIRVPYMDGTMRWSPISESYVPAFGAIEYTLSGRDSLGRLLYL